MEREEGLSCGCRNQNPPALKQHLTGPPHFGGTIGVKSLENLVQLGHVTIEHGHREH